MAGAEQRNAHLYKLLFRSKFYSLLGSILEKKSTRDLLMNEYIKPFAGAKILDLGCGPARILEDLPSSVEYHGCDSNPKYIADVKEKYGDRGNFRVVDFNSAEFNSGNDFVREGYDVVLIMGVLHHLPDESARKLLAIAKNAIAPGGRLFCLDNVLTSQQNPIARWLILHDRGIHIRGIEQHMGLFTESWPEVAYSVRTDLMRVPYTHILVHDDITKS